MTIPKQEFKMRRSAIFWGGMLVLFGLLFLLSNLGVLDINIWSLFWPILLIGWGLWFLYGYFFRPKMEVEHATVPLQGAVRARLRINHGAGKLNIYAGTGEGDLAEGDFGGGLDLSSRRSGDTLDVTMKVPSQVFMFPFGPGGTLDWSFGLARQLPLELELETGANDAQLDLTDLQVSNLRLKSGASSTIVRLPASTGSTRVSVETGAASVKLYVPQGVAARISGSSGLASIHVDERRFPRVGGANQSPDYETAINKVEITISVGVGSVDVS
jgi:hypothetical protein